MALSNAQVSVATTATLLSAAETDLTAGESVAITNTGSVTVYLGNASVSTSNGYSLAAGAAMSLDLGSGESLYAVVATGTSTVGVLRTGT